MRVGKEGTKWPAVLEGINRCKIKKLGVPMSKLLAIILVLISTVAYAGSCIDCHTNEAAMKSLVKVKAAVPEEGEG